MTWLAENWSGRYSAWRSSACTSLVMAVMAGTGHMEAAIAGVASLPRRPSMNLTLQSAPARPTPIVTRSTPC